MKSRVILDSKEFDLTLRRLCFQLIENHNDFSSTVIIGIQPRGVYLSDRLVQLLKSIKPNIAIKYGKLDITFYRDDFRRSEKLAEPSKTEIDFTIEGKNVVLVDDVLYTGRTIRASLDSLLDYGRPENVELLTLIDRRLKRHLPIQPNYVGKVIDSIEAEKVKVDWKEIEGKDSVWIVEKNQQV